MRSAEKVTEYVILFCKAANEEVLSADQHVVQVFNDVKNYETDGNVPVTQTSAHTSSFLASKSFELKKLVS